MDCDKSPENWTRMRKKLIPVCFRVFDVIWQIYDGTGSSDPSMSQYCILDAIHLIGMYFS